MICACGGQLKETNWTTKDGTNKKVKTCVGCGRRREEHYKNGKKIYERGQLICKCGDRLHHEEKPGANGKRYHYQTCKSCGRQYVEVRSSSGLLLHWFSRRVKVEIPERV